VGLFPHPAANSLIARFLQKLFVAEFASLIGVGAVGIAVGRPNMANGANMAFSKAAFEAVGGYEGSWHIPSGDDEWLLQRIHAHFPGQIAFAWGTGALVTTAAPRSWSAFAQQRKRWASKWTKSQSGMGKLLAVSVFGFHLLGLWALVGLIMETENRAWLWAGILAKMLTETLFVGQVLSDTDRGKYVKFLPLISLLYPLYACYFGLAGIFGTYEWKGREARHKI
jgi:cellulose synthase/poly-beta-1,6-N-acetylglucosamine synthase-like glycosyltransferase